MPTLKKPRKCKFSKDGVFHCSKSSCVIERSLRVKNPVSLGIRLLGYSTIQSNPAMCKHAVHYVTINEILNPVYETIDLKITLEDSDANT